MMEDTSDNANAMQDDGDIEVLRKQHVTRGLSGLINLANTCYLNASLQCISATDEMVSYIRGSGKSGKYKPYLKNAIIKTIAEEERKKGKVGKIIVNVKDVRKRFKDSLTYKLRNVMVVMWGVNCKVKPILFKHKLGQLDSIYAGYMQNDSQECVNYILDRLHEETKSDVIIELRNIPDEILQYKEVKDKYTELINKEDTEGEEKIKVLDEFREFKNSHLKEDACLKAIEYWQKFIRKNHSIIIDLFYGLDLSEVKCCVCNNISFTHQPYTSLAIQIPNKQQQQQQMHQNYQHHHNQKFPWMHNTHHGIQMRYQAHIAQAKAINENNVILPSAPLDELLKMDGNINIIGNTPITIVNHPLVEAKDDVISEVIEDESPENKKELTLYECLNATFNIDELLTGDNQLTCDTCLKRQDVTKKTTLWHCPPRLILHLKRFINVPVTPKYTRSEKVEKLVKFPITGLSLNDYMSEYVSGDCIYDLYAVIHQMGSLQGGHYVAYTKNPISGEWYYYDDHNVKRIKPEDLESKLVTHKAYILFYEKRCNVNVASGFSSDEDSDDSDIDQDR
jgi:ubiquitin C-terminal hydrolase